MNIKNINVMTFKVTDSKISLTTFRMSASIVLQSYPVFVFGAPFSECVLKEVEKAGICSHTNFGNAG